MGFNKALIIGALVVSIASLVLTALLLDIGTEYDIEVPSEYEEVFNEYSATKDLTEELNTVIEGGDVNPEGQDQAVYKNVVVAGKISRQSSGLAINMLNQTPKIFGIPVTIAAILITIVILFATFGFMAMISRRTP
jgi:multisubunit Na+/H+ antiporter MnhC subunit